MKKIIVLILCVFLLSGCSGKAGKERQMFSMDTHIVMNVYGKCSEETLDKAEAEVERINEKFGINNIDKTCSSPDDETKALLKTAQDIKTNTDGAFDVNIAPLMRIWGFYSSQFSEKNHRIPTQSEIDEAMDASSAGVYIDLGGIAKGYCADKVSEILKGDGVESAVLSFGGNVALIGKPVLDEKWAVGIQSPFDEGIYATIYANDTAVVTSGDYMRFFEEGGKRYHHILNPATGYPAESDLTSVTVIADSGVIADGLSTALFVMGREKAENYWRNSGDFEMVLITKDGSIYYTGGVDIDSDKEMHKIN